jgi:hypothetical protein
MCPTTKLFTDADAAQIGNWIASTPIPKQSLKLREQLLNDRSKYLFVQFIRTALCWVPEEKPNAEELAFDEFLIQYQENDLM